MKLTKDEASILAYLMSEGKYALNERVSETFNKNGIRSINAFESLEKRLTEQGDDKRRHGRMSMNSLYDILIRFVITSEKRGTHANNISTEPGIGK